MSYRDKKRRELKEIFDIQEVLRSNYQSKKFKERVMIALWGKIREHEIDRVNNGVKVYYKKAGENK